MVVPLLTECSTLTDFSAGLGAVLVGTSHPYEAAMAAILGNGGAHVSSTASSPDDGRHRDLRQAGADRPEDRAW